MASHTVSHLTADHFGISGHRQPALVLKLQGIYLVFFCSPASPNHPPTEKIFRELSQTEGRIKYGMLDVSKYREVVALSKGTTTPIQSIPVFILYFQGTPHVKYSGAINVRSLQTFVGQVLENVSRQQGGGFSGPPPSDRNTGPSMVSTASGMVSTAPGMNSRYSTIPAHPSGASMSGRGAPPGRASGYGGGAHADIAPNYHMGASAVEEEDENVMLNPANVIPYNKPWQPLLEMQ